MLDYSIKNCNAVPTDLAAEVVKSIRNNGTSDFTHAKWLIEQEALKIGSQIGTSPKEVICFRSRQIFEGDPAGSDLIRFR